MLGALLDGAREVLRERFVGLYLYGSLATGDFSVGTSDIDFAVVTEGELSDAQVAALGAMHARLEAPATRHTRGCTAVGALSPT